jgi:hypothetical protein
MIASFPPGGVAGTMHARSPTRELKQPVLVENHRTPAWSASARRRAAADGYLCS